MAKVTHRCRKKNWKILQNSSLAHAKKMWNLSVCQRKNREIQSAVKNIAKYINWLQENTAKFVKWSGKISWNSSINRWKISWNSSFKNSTDEWEFPINQYKVLFSKTVYLFRKIANHRPFSHTKVNIINLQTIAIQSKI